MLLLDTHVVVWLALEPRRVSKTAAQAMIAAKERHGLAIAGCTLWEIALLHAKQKIRLDISLEDFLLRVERVYRLLPLTRQIALRGVQFTGAYPKDPADRQIGATALLHGLQLISADRSIRSSGEVPTVW